MPMYYILWESFLDRRKQSSCVTSPWNIEKMTKRILTDIVRNKVLLVLLGLILILIVKPHFKVHKTVELHFKKK